MGRGGASGGPLISNHSRTAIARRPRGFRRVLRSSSPLKIILASVICFLALQLRFLRSSESIGHHDSEIVDDGYFDRDDAGALGVIAAGCQSADGAIVHPGAGGGF